MSVRAKYPSVFSGRLGKQRIDAVDDVSFVIRRGETLGLVGGSGCGKTTLGMFLLLAFAALLAEPMAAEEFKIVTDMRGVDVLIHEDPQRVVAISRSLIGTTMYIFGVEDKLVGASVWTRNDGYEDYTWGSETYHVCPWISFVINPDYRNVGYAFGTETIESIFLEDIVNAKNVYDGAGTDIISTEHLLSLDPDVIVLCTDFGYHPPRELYEAPYYQDLQEMDAVKNKRVTALPWSPCNCDKRLEYPIDVMAIAKAAYPDKFEDVDLGEWLLDFT